jgi:hypothetical protein
MQSTPSTLTTLDALAALTTLCVQNAPPITQQPRVEMVYSFLSSQDADALVSLLDGLFKARASSYSFKRSSITYGDEGVKYTIHFKNGTVHRQAIPWPEWLLPLRDKIKQWCPGVSTCVVQRYPCGKVGIKPHRDKEMTRGTIICGLSVGQERTLRMNYNGKSQEYQLENGSVYLLHPPTNDVWTHCIPTDQSKGVRYSLTFRDYR